MSKQVIQCDFTDGDQERGFTWFDKHYQGIATATLWGDGVLEFSGKNHRVHIENIGTPQEKVIVVDISDLDQ